jgi:ATP adenylyltransferase
MGYIRTAKNEFGPCLFCDKSHVGKDEDDLVVHRGENAYILMNLYPYNNGHLMVVPYDHEKHFDDLQTDTQVEMMNLMSQAIGVLRESLSADGFNFGANFGEVAGAGIKEHLHLHLVP